MLPPVKVKLPQDAKEMGPQPGTGMMIWNDIDKHQITFFDSASGTLKTIPYTVVERHDKVLRDDPRVTKVKLPAVDRQKKTITLYSRRYRVLITFSVADEYLALPGDTWKAGDEIRYYYKDPGQALRMMNVSRTDLSKSEK